MKNPIFQRESTTIDFDERDPYIELHSLRTRSHERNKGSATRTMREFLEYADSRGKDVRLYASPLDRRTRIGRLIEFYRALGFEETGKKINALGHPEMVRYRKRNPVDEPLQIIYDQGNPRWLQEEQDYNRKQGQHRTGAGTLIPRRFGAVTAWLNRPALIPLPWIDDLPGLSGEERFVRQNDFDSLMSYMSVNNKLPPMSNGQQYVPMIQVWQDGRWYINEGNHRIKVAKALRWKCLPVDIRWYSGGENIQDPKRGIDPKTVMELDTTCHRAGFSVTDFRGTL